MTGQAPGPAACPPQGLDVTVPNVARIYDHLLGGEDVEADREAARRLLVAVPGAARAARANRKMLARAVQFLGREAGIRQFLDIGTGCPPAVTCMRSPRSLTRRCTCCTPTSTRWW